MKKFNPPNDFVQDYSNLINFIKQYEFHKEVGISPEEMEKEIIEIQNSKENFFKLQQSYFESKDRYNLSKNIAYEHYRKTLELIRLKAKENPVAQSSLATFKKHYKRKKKNSVPDSTVVESENLK